MLFPFSVRAIKHEMSVSYNSKMCKELTHLFKESLKILRIFEESQPMVFFEYKSISKKLGKFCELIETLGEVNRSLIHDKQAKVSSLFIQNTRLFSDIKDILMKIKIIPFNGEEASFWEYYHEQDDIDRLTTDSKNVVRENPGHLYRKKQTVFERRVPIFSSDEDIELMLNLKDKIEVFQEICLQSVKPFKCFGKRHNCCTLSMEQIFGKTKQLEFVLS
jgi:hypothetical protein